MTRLDEITTGPGHLKPLTIIRFETNLGHVFDGESAEICERLYERVVDLEIYGLWLIRAWRRSHLAGSVHHPGNITTGKPVDSKKRELPLLLTDLQLVRFEPPVLAVQRQL